MKDSPIAVATQMVREGKADAMVERRQHRRD